MTQGPSRLFRTCTGSHKAAICIDWNQRKSEFSTSLQHHLVCNADFFFLSALQHHFQTQRTHVPLMLSINTIKSDPRTSGQAGAAAPQSWQFNTTSHTRSPFTIKHVQMSQLYLPASAMGKAMHFPSTSDLRQSRTMQHTRPMKQDAMGKEHFSRELEKCCYVHQRTPHDVNCQKHKGKTQICACLFIQLPCPRPDNFKHCPLYKTRFQWFFPHSSTSPTTPRHVLSNIKCKVSTSQHDTKIQTSVSHNNQTKIIQF